MKITLLWHGEKEFYEICFFQWKVMIRIQTDQRFLAASIHGFWRGWFLLLALYCFHTKILPVTFFSTLLLQFSFPINQVTTINGFLENHKPTINGFLEYHEPSINGFLRYHTHSIYGRLGYHRVTINGDLGYHRVRINGYLGYHRASINGYLRYHTPDHLWYLGYHGKIIHENLALRGWNHKWS